MPDDVLLRYENLLRDRLIPVRLAHVLSVVDYLLSFAPALELEQEAVRMVGLLHDLCRDMNGAQLLEKAHAYAISFTEIEEQQPTLLHGPVAAEEARRELGVTDPAVYEAIYWHTTGKAGLNRLGQALYFADFSEPLRRYPEAAQARAVLDAEGFDTALLHVAQVKRFMLSKKASVAPASEDYFQWLETGKP